MEITITVFGAGVASGIGLSVWTCQQLNRFRGPGYYRRRARRVTRGQSR